MSWIDLIPITKTRQKVWEYINALIGNTEYNKTGGGGFVPTGTILPFSSSTVPDNYLECDGSTVSRTSYSDLFNIIGESWGEGDGTTTFSLPDLRGYFLRGYDHGAGNDPNAASRTEMSTGGATGDNVGSRQDHAMQGHTHDFYYVDFRLGSGGSGMYVRSTSNTTKFSTGGLIRGPVTYGYGAPLLSTESRGKNASVMFIIKYV